MKKLNLLFVFLIGIMISIVLNSCNSCNPDRDKEDIAFEEIEVDTTLFDTYDSQFDQQDSLGFIGRGSTWRTWRKLHKECMKAQWLRRPYYFGVSSTVNLGSIVDKDFDLQRSMDATSGFNDEDLTSIINYGNFTSCGYTQEMTMSLNVFLQSEFDFTQTGEPDLNAELQTSIAKSNKTKVKVDNWRINNVREDNLIDVLEAAKDSDIKKKKFQVTLKKEKHHILIKVIEIKGFTSYIELEREMSPGLEAKLKEGIVAPIGNAGIKAKFKFKDKRTIEVKSGGNFYVFGQFKKVKKVIL